jgi:hypothetical protein
MADRCSFCGSIAGPFNRVEGLFTVLMCADCQAARGYGSGPYPVMTIAEMRVGLDLLPTWALEQKAAAFSVPTASELLSLLHGYRSADHHPCPHRHLGICRRDGEALAGLRMAAGHLTGTRLPACGSTSRRGLPGVQASSRFTASGRRLHLGGLRLLAARSWKRAARRSQPWPRPRNSWTS